MTPPEQGGRDFAVVTFGEGRPPVLWVGGVEAATFATIQGAMGTRDAINASHRKALTEAYERCARAVCILCRDGVSRIGAFHYQMDGKFPCDADVIRKAQEVSGG